jgi:hypothetical protein
MKCFTEYDPIWVEIAYWSIVRRNQMDGLRMLDEDEWPDKSVLDGYEPRFPDDVNYYHPEDYVRELSMFLRDNGISGRKKRLQSKRENERAEVSRAMRL